MAEELRALMLMAEAPRALISRKLNEGQIAPRAAAELNAHAKGALEKVLGLDGEVDHAVIVLDDDMQVSPTER